MDVVKKNNNEWVEKKSNTSIKVGRSEKMSKSKKNVITIDSIIKKFGVDSSKVICSPATAIRQIIGILKNLAQLFLPIVFFIPLP